MKNVLNVIVDMLTLMALCVAAVGHVLPWLEAHRLRLPGTSLANFQGWHAEHSGIALGVLGALVSLSLLINWGPEMRRVLNLLMFGSAFAALLFQLMIFSHFEQAFDSDQRLGLRDTGPGFALAMIPTCCALFLCLLRMLWTMPATGASKAIPATPATLDKAPEKKVHAF